MSKGFTSGYTVALWADQCIFAKWPLQMQKAPGLQPHLSPGKGSCDTGFSALFIVTNIDTSTEEA